MALYEKISADEAFSLRKEVADENGVMAKGLPLSPDVVRAPGLNVEAREATFVVSAEAPDRMGDIVVQSGIDTTNFEANPVGLLFHNSRNFPIGTWRDIRKNLSGRPKRTEATLRFMAEGDEPDADRAFRHVRAGTMRTVSIGFRPDYKEAERIKDADGRTLGVRWNKSELLEISVVPVPALPAATMKEMSVGLLSAESKELIAGILDAFELRDGQVHNREHLEDVLRDAHRARVTHVMPEVIARLREDIPALRDGDGKRLIPISAEVPMTLISKIAEVVDADASANAEVVIIKRSNTPPAPKDGEEVPVAPDPADDEKQKSEEAAQAESVAAFNAHTLTVAREHAMRSQEPGLWAKFLGALSPAPVDPVDPVERAEPELDTPEPAALTVEEKAALEERIANRIRATERATEPA